MVYSLESIQINTISDNADQGCFLMTLRQELRRVKKRLTTFGDRHYGSLKMRITGGFRGQGCFAPYMNAEDGQCAIADIIREPKPCMIARYGLFELRAVAKVKYGYSGLWALHDLCFNAGFFPRDEKLLVPFAEVYSVASKQIDVFCAWNYRHGHFRDERTVFVSNCPDATLTDIHALDFFKSGRPWTLELAGKKVLVVHPLRDDILRQYEKRHLIFPNSEILPEFAKLSVIKAVQSAAGEQSGFDSWFSALEFMQHKIDSVDYDIAVIGAGAYGLPLAAHVKKSGKTAVHLGGITQMLFGIYGRRWEQSHSEFINEHWTRPSLNDRPSAYKKVEDGCYW